MFFEKDYILRVIEQIGEFFRRLTELASRADQRAALDRFCRERCLCTLDGARALDTGTAAELMNETTRFLLSEVLYLDGMLLRADEEKTRSYLKALRLLSGLSGDGPLCMERSPRLKELAGLCRDEMTGEDDLACASFFMNGGRYDAMEDMIFFGAECEGNTKDRIARGLDMMYNARVMPDETLILGGLPREELESGIAELTHMLEEYQ